MAGVHIYSLLCERMFGRRPRHVQLLYLSKPRARSSPHRATSPLRGVEVKTSAVMQASAHGVRSDDFRPRPSALCSYLLVPVSSAPSSAGRSRTARPTLLARQAEARQAAPPRAACAFVRPRSGDSTTRSTASSARVRNPTLDAIRVFPLLERG